MADVPLLDRASFLALDKEKLFALLELAIKGQRESAENMLKMTKMMAQAETTLTTIRNENDGLRAEIAELRRLQGCSP